MGVCSGHLRLGVLLGPREATGLMENHPEIQANILTIKVLNF